MDPAARLLRLLSLLQERGEQPAKQLADRLGVTTRTLRRDVTRLRDLGYPVDVTPGHAGYTLGSHGKLPPLLLSDDEGFAIAHGLRLAAAAPVEGVGDAALAALRKLEPVLPPAVRARVQALEIATVHADPGVPEPLLSIDTLVAIATTCQQRERITFAYVDFHGESTARRVEPLNLVHLMRRWYLVAYDCDRRDWRTFRVDRIREVTRTGHTFELDEIPDAARRVIEGVATLGRPSSARVLVDVEPDDARRRYSRFGTIEPTSDGRSIVHLTADSLEQIARSIASMSCVWRILEPVELVDLVLAHGTRIRRLARQSTKDPAFARG